MMNLDIALPYRTDWRELIGVLDYCKGKGADRASLEARFGGGESLRETLNALEQLGLAERGETGDVRLTRRGDRLAYAPDLAQLRSRLIETLLDYEPYRYPLERAAADGLTVLEGPWVEHIWQVDMRLGQPRNRAEEARTFFFRLCDEAGLGVYRRGVRGQTTRLDLPPDTLDRLRQALQAREETLRQAAVPAERPAPEPGAPAGAPAGDTGAGRTPPGRAEGIVEIPPGQIAAPAAPGGPSLSIQVDLTGWDLEKIEAFLRLIGYLPRASE